MQKHLLGQTLADLEEWFASSGQAKYRAAQVMNWLYGKRVSLFTEMTDLPTPLRAALEEAFLDQPLEVIRCLGSKDTTRKFLFRLPDGQAVESVLIPANLGEDGSRAGRMTLCVSSQVGCAYGCRFCASGLDGWKRNLGAHEIVGQVLAAEKESGERVDNIVFMGMGEPLANFEALMQAIRILNAPWGIGIGARRITVSTSGLAPKIKELAAQPLQIRLAVSLHGATDEVRERIMPVNRKYPLTELMSACAEYVSRKKQKPTFEYILISGVNDAPEQARALCVLARRLGAKVNLIPYNRVEGLPWERPKPAEQRHFLRILTDQGVQATIRNEKGDDIAAACGQLRLQTLREKSFAAPPALA